MQFIVRSPYLQLIRFHQPVGWLLVSMPCLWVLAWHRPLPPFSLWAIFLLGSFVMRSFGCIINDMTDRSIDRQVARTKLRPLAANTVSVTGALVLSAFLAVIGLGLLGLLPPRCWVVGVAIVPLVLAYPWMKRWFVLPQLFLGIVFNSGIFLAWLALYPHLTLIPVLFYLAALCWTIGYDTLYAHQDIEDDRQVGIFSAAITFGNASFQWVAAFYGVTSLFILLIGLMTHASLGYYIGWLAASLQFAWQVKYIDPQDNTTFHRAFRANIGVGLTIMLACFVR